MPIYKVEGVKKDGKQKYRVIVNYKNSAGQYNKAERIAYGKAEAEILENKLNIKYKQDSESYSSNMTVQELYNVYIENKKYDVRETSLDKSTKILERHILPYLSEYKIKKLMPLYFRNGKIKLTV